MNLKIPEPIMVEDVRKKVIGNRRGLIVDDLDLLLRRIFDDEVRYATIDFAIMKFRELLEKE